MTSSTSSSSARFALAQTVASWAWRRTGIVFATLMMLLLIGELYIRAFFLPTLFYEPDPELGFVHRPHQRCISWLGNFSVPSPPLSFNSDGNRGSETDWEQTILLALGSSEVVGPGIEDSRTWCEVLEGLMREGDNGKHVVVVNGGIGGHGPNQHAVSLDRVLEQHTIDTAIIRVSVEDRNFGPPSDVVAKTALREFLRNETRFVRFLVTKAQAQIQPIRKAAVPYPFRQGGQTPDPQFGLAAERMWEANEPYWTRSVDSAARHGIRLVFLVINPAGLEGNSFLARKLADLCHESANADVLELGPEHFGLQEVDVQERDAIFHRRFTLGYDPHANADQHRLVAISLHRFLCH